MENEKCLEKGKEFLKYSKAHNGAAIFANSFFTVQTIHFCTDSSQIHVIWSSFHKKSLCFYQTQNIFNTLEISVKKHCLNFWDWKLNWKSKIWIESSRERKEGPYF